MRGAIVGTLIGLLLAALFTVLPRAWPERFGSEAEDTSTPHANPVVAGEYLARAGNCIACHTAPGGADYAGGRVIPTPFGNVYSSNLTPDHETGLGDWSADEFWRAMHYGRGRDGRRLNPAFPYTNYTQITRADSDALLAYLQSRPAVSSPNKPSELRFPYNTQIALLAWQALYFKPGVMVANPAYDAAWNRGAYLVEGLGHCNACHTTRDALGGIREQANYAGGPIPMLGWDALPLVGAHLPDAKELPELLRTGVSAREVMTGPMAEVVFHSLQYLSESDIAAMSTYLLGLPQTDIPAPTRVPQVSVEERERLMALGEKTYRQHCTDCHGEQGEGEARIHPALAGNRLVTAPSARNAIQTLIYGGFPPSTAGNPQPYGMPPYGHQLSKAEMAAVLTYIRNSWGNAAAPVSVPELERY